MNGVFEVGLVNTENISGFQAAKDSSTFLQIR